MNVLGVGGSELLIVLLVMLVIAGPKRMIHWSYVLGQHMAKFRRMWSETVDIVQQEFDEAGVGIQLPKDVPTRGSLQKQAGKVVGGVTAPVQDTLKEVNTQLGDIKTGTREAAGSANTVTRGNNGAQTVLKVDKSPKPAMQSIAAAESAAGGSAAVASVRTTAPARRKLSGREDEDFGAWSSHEKAHIGSWSGKEKPSRPEAGT
jgi:Sec-independent protein translocase protein TatA